MNVLKKFVFSVLFLVEGFFCIGFTATAFEKITKGTFTIEQAVVPLFLYGCLIITIIALYRIRDKEYTIISVMYMKAVMAIISFSYYSFVSGTWPLGIIMAVFAVFAYSAASIGKNPAKEESASIRYQGFTGFSYLWQLPETIEEYTSIHQISNEYVDTAVIIDACNYICPLFLWLVHRDGLSLRFTINEKQKELLKEGIIDPREFFYFHSLGRLFRNDIKDDYLRFLDQYFSLKGQYLKNQNSYAKDYKEIIEKDSHWHYCIPYDRKSYVSFVNILDERFEDYENGLLK